MVSKLIKEREVITISKLSTEKDMESVIKILKKRIKSGTISVGETAEDFVNNTFTILIETFRYKGYYTHMKYYKEGRSASIKKGNKHRYKRR